MNKKILKKLDNLIEKYVNVASASKTTQILTQTFAYYGDQTEDGIQNVRDVSTDVHFSMNVPCINFLDCIEMLLELKKEGFGFLHYYKNEIKPYDNGFQLFDSCTNTQVSPGYAWQYFEVRKENTLRNWPSAYLRTSVYMAIFYIEDFNTFLFFRIKNSDDYKMEMTLD